MEVPGVELCEYCSSNEIEKYRFHKDGEELGEMHATCVDWFYTHRR